MEVACQAHVVSLATERTAVPAIVPMVRHVGWSSGLAFTQPAATGGGDVGHSKKGEAVDTSPRSGNCADLAVQPERDRSAAPIATTLVMRADRNRTLQTTLPQAIQCGVRGNVGPSRDAHAASARSGALRDIARQTLSGSADLVLAEARNACRREGVSATRRELFTRVAKRIGLSQAEVARRLDGDIRRDFIAAEPEAAGLRQHQDAVARLATTILGARERDVFLARRDARPDDVAALHRLAAGLGLSVERVYELEASARRKLAMALG